MSAVPQMPESLHNPHLDGLYNKKTSATHVENIKLNGNGVMNGIETNNSVGQVTNDFQMHDVVVENFRPIKVIVIGAGYSGIYHGIRIPERIKNCELVIYEKNAGVGGTWYENRYPGCACDVSTIKL